MQRIHRHRLELGIDTDILISDVVILCRLDRVGIGMFVMCDAAHTPPSPGIRYRYSHFDSRYGHTVASGSCGSRYVCDV
jgi:hypothetical protein